jgi:hypothetical protein
MRTSAALLGLSLAAACVYAPVVEGAIIGIDDRNGFDASSYLGTGEDYDLFRDVITSLGHTIVPLTSFDAGDLTGLDAVFVKHPYSGSQAFSASEISALQTFVAGGGGLVAGADGGGGSDSHVDNFNDLVSPYGVVFAPSAIDPAGHVVSDLVAHPVTAGVSSFGVDFQRTLISISGPALDLTVGSGSDDALAVVDGVGGAGNVVLLSDTTLWKDADTGADYPLTALDNQLLLENIVGYAIPAPPVLALLGGLAFAPRRRRR